jgi:hypothetical protein
MSISGISGAVFPQHVGGATPPAGSKAAVGNDHDGDEINGVDPAGERDSGGGNQQANGASNPALGRIVNITA